MCIKYVSTWCNKGRPVSLSIWLPIRPFLSECHKSKLFIIDCQTYTVRGKIYYIRSVSRTSFLFCFECLYRKYLWFKTFYLYHYKLPGPIYFRMLLLNPLFHNEVRSRCENSMPVSHGRWRYWDARLSLDVRSSKWDWVSGWTDGSVTDSVENWADERAQVVGK